MQLSSHGFTTADQEGTGGGETYGQHGQTVIGSTTTKVRPGCDGLPGGGLLALGVRFDDRTSSSWLPGYSFTIPPTKLIHVDIDPDEIARNYPVALGLMADVRTFLRQVLNEVATRKTVNDGAASRKKWLAKSA